MTSSRHILWQRANTFRRTGRGAERAGPEPPVPQTPLDYQLRTTPCIQSVLVNSKGTFLGRTKCPKNQLEPMVTWWAKRQIKTETWFEFEIILTSGTWKIQGTCDQSKECRSVCHRQHVTHFTGWFGDRWSGNKAFVRVVDFPVEALEVASHPRCAFVVWVFQFFSANPDVQWRR